MFGYAPDGLRHSGHALSGLCHLQQRACAGYAMVCYALSWLRHVWLRTERTTLFAATPRAG